MSCECLLIKYLDERFAEIKAAYARVEEKLDGALAGQTAVLGKLRDKLGANDEAIDKVLAEK